MRKNEEWQESKESLLMDIWKKASVRMTHPKSFKGIQQALAVNWVLSLFELSNLPGKSPGVGWVKLFNHLPSDHCTQNDASNARLHLAVCNNFTSTFTPLGLELFSTHHNLLSLLLCFKVTIYFSTIHILNDLMDHPNDCYVLEAACPIHNWPRSKKSKRKEEMHFIFTIWTCQFQTFL